jgi:hypothetical protein
MRSPRTGTVSPTPRRTRGLLLVVHFTLAYVGYTVLTPFVA